MKINSKATAATLILAASVIPAFGQFRGHGSERGLERGGHPLFQQQRSFQAPSEQRNWQRSDSFRNRRLPQYEQRSQPQYQNRQFAQPQPSYRPRSNWQQPAYRPDARQYGGTAYRGERGSPYDSRAYEFDGSRRYLIPQNRFYSSFGRDHFFRIGRPLFYGRYPRFQYGGFWFNFVGAPPNSWGPDWYYTDDVYINYSDGGYYLYDNRYPAQGVPLAVDNGDAYGEGYGAPPDATPGSPYSGPYGNGYGVPDDGPY